jgi:hypothetical protein
VGNAKGCLTAPAQPDSRTASCGSGPCLRAPGSAPYAAVEHQIKRGGSYNPT